VLEGKRMQQLNSVQQFYEYSSEHCCQRSRSRTSQGEKYFLCQGVRASGSVHLTFRLPRNLTYLNSFWESILDYLHSPRPLSLSRAMELFKEQELSVQSPELWCTANEPGLSPRVSRQKASQRYVSENTLRLR
jgi:hypothetical protein